MPSRVGVSPMFEVCRIGVEALPADTSDGRHNYNHFNALQNWHRSRSWLGVRTLQLTYRRAHMNSKTKLLISTILTLALGLPLARLALDKRYPARTITSQAAVIASSIDVCDAPDSPAC